MTKVIIECLLHIYDYFGTRISGDGTDITIKTQEEKEQRSTLKCCCTRPGKK